MVVATGGVTWLVDAEPLPGGPGFTCAGRGMLTSTTLGVTAAVSGKLIAVTPGVTLMVISGQAGYDDRLLAGRVESWGE